MAEKSHVNSKSSQILAQKLLDHKQAPKYGKYEELYNQYQVLKSRKAEKIEKRKTELKDKEMAGVTFKPEIG